MVARFRKPEPESKSVPWWMLVAIVLAVWLLILTGKAWEWNRENREKIRQIREDYRGQQRSINELRERIDP